jgi:hypothetical protein
MDHKVIALSLGLLCCGTLQAAGLKAGAASTDITPPTGYPMWGYAARRDKPSIATHDPLFARALVLQIADAKIAIVSLDLGRAPHRESIQRIREALKPQGFMEVFLVATHTHHGPILELDNWPSPPEQSYTRKLEEKIVTVIKKADAAQVPARYGVASTETKLNRNRQSKRDDKPTDPELLVLRLENLKGQPIAHAVNFAAHPTMHPAEMMKFSADFPGAMAQLVEAETQVPCLFLQGAAGDLSANPPEGVKGPDAFGKHLGTIVLKLINTISMTEPKQDSKLQASREELKFPCVVDLSNPQIKFALGKVFFPELVGFFEKEYREGVRPTVTVALLDQTIGFVGFSGEPFSEHALSLRRRARLPHVFVMGYCNDYQQYFPTIQAVAEGGYGTAPPVANAEIGAGEHLTNRALIHLYQLRGKLPIPK